MCGNRYLCNTDLKPIQLFYKVCFHNFTGKKLNYLLICIVGRILATAHVTGRRTGIEIRGQGIGSPGWVFVQGDRLLASSMSARAPWSRSRCSWRRRLAAPPWVLFSSSAVSSSPFSSSDWRNSIGSCCSWSCPLALPCGFTLVVVGARCSRVRQYLQ